MGFETVFVEILSPNSGLGDLIAGLMGGSAGVGAIMLFLANNIKKFLDVDNNNEGTKTVPFLLSFLLKLFGGGVTWEMKEEDIAWICNQLPSFEERKIIRDEIAAYARTKTAYFVLTTSIGDFPISQGYIDVANIALRPGLTALQEEVSLKPDNTSQNSEGRKIGALSVVSSVLNGRVIQSGVQLSVPEIVGKKLIVGFLGKDYGDVIMGFFFDGEMIGEGACYTKPGVLEYLSAKMPEHDSDYPPGIHLLEIKQGYRDGWLSYNGTPGSSGDQNSFKEELTIRYEITIP